MSSQTFPRDLVVDVHDIAAIILNCHAQLETEFAGYQLVEVNRGSTPLQTLPEGTLPPEWYIMRHRSVVYILKKEPNAPSPVTIDTFAHPNGVKTPNGEPLSRKELEDVFWRCKCFNSGNVLTYVAQQVFDALPSSSKLLARTSQGHTVTCAAHETTVAEIAVKSREACLHVVYNDRPDLGPTKVDLGHRLSGFDGSFQWVWLFIGPPTSSSIREDARVALDLSISQIGGRGCGFEFFALEKTAHHYENVLLKFAVDLGEDMKLSAKQMLTPVNVQHGDAVKRLVLERLAKVVAGDDHFCRYCGKDNVDLICSRCKKAHFCRECQALGWKYHKRWCQLPDISQ